MTLIMWPKLEEEKPPKFKALMITSALPSKITWSTFSSLAKHIALHAANTSTVSIEVGSGIGCEKGAITRPLSLWIIAPKLARFLEGKVAPSKLTLSQPEGGGDHVAGLIEGGGRRGREEARWNSWRLSTAKEQIRLMGTKASPARGWFHRDQISAAVMANSSKRLLFSWQRWMISSKEEQFKAFLINQSKWTFEIRDRQGQDQRAWREDSLSILQFGQEALDRILLSGGSLW